MKIKKDRVLNDLKLCLFLSNSERAGIRTPDNLIKSQVLYHLSYTPIYHCLLAKISKITGWVMGFEPTASRATIWRANQLRHTHHNRFDMKKEIGFRRPSTLPGSCPPSTIDRLGLNRRVRNGNGCVPQAHHHRRCFVCFLFCLKV